MVNVRMISPILAPLALLVTTLSFFPSPVSSTLPMDDDVPRAINTINKMIQEAKDYYDITREIGWAVERWGYIELKQYCQLNSTRQRFSGQCGKLDELQSVNYVGRWFKYDYHWDEGHFTVHSITASLDAYLTIIGNNMGGTDQAAIKEPVTDNLTKALLENGMKEMKEYCNKFIGGKEENKLACQLVKSMMVSDVQFQGYQYVIPVKSEETRPNVVESSSRSSSKSKGWLRNVLPKFSKN